jgi:DNA-binding protein H-NS
MKRTFSSLSLNHSGVGLKFLSPVLITLLLTLGCATNVRADTVKSYQERVDNAIKAIDTLTQSDESETYEAYEQRVTETLTNVRSLLPPQEDVTWEETKITIDNRWLHEQLAEFEKSRESDRQDKLKQVLERLQAIAERLTGAGLSSSAKLSKEGAKSKLAEVLARREYTQKNNEGSALDRLIRRLLEWLRNLMPKQKQLSPGGAQVFTQIAYVIVVLLALAVIAYALKMFLPRFFKRTGSVKRSKAEPRIVLGETLAPDQSAGDLLADAETLARRGELRAAIRKAYIALLVELGDRKLISLAQYKTNRDYLRAVRQLEPLHANLKGLTDSFERHWYGIAPATQDDWNRFRLGYAKALTRRESV